MFHVTTLAHVVVKRDILEENVSPAKAVTTKEPTTVNFAIVILGEV